jgi:hypothetical protein
MKAWMLVRHPTMILSLVQVRNLPRGASGFADILAGGDSNRSTNTPQPPLNDLAPKPLTTSCGDPRDAEMESSSCRTAILQPFRTDYLPEPTSDAPLFLPANDERIWYTGWLNRWGDFRQLAHDSWISQNTKIAFDEIKGDSVDAPRAADPIAGEDIQGPKILEDHFSREVLEVVEKVYGRLLATTTMQETGGDTVPAGVVTVNLAEAIVSAIRSPEFTACAITADGDEELRLVGHVEYLGGRPGALTWAVKENAKNSRGSLRCVLGELSDITCTRTNLMTFLLGQIAWAMLKANTAYGFVISSDEIMFLRFDIDIRTVEANIAPRGIPPEIADVNAVTEPRVYYSDPIKHTDLLDPPKGTIPAKLALLYMVHTAMTGQWKLPDAKGKSAAAFTMTKAGEKLRVPDLRKGWWNS